MKKILWVLGILLFVWANAQMNRRLDSSWEKAMEVVSSQEETAKPYGEGYILPEGFFGE